MDANLQRAVIEVAGTWETLADSDDGDPNTIDLYSHAQRVEQVLRCGVPDDLPERAAGVALVELVEQHFVAPGFIRMLAPADLSERAGTLVDAIAKAGLLPYCSPQQRYIAALYAWHGCINMAKLLRPSYNVAGGQEVYSDQQRIKDYDWLRGCWTQETVKRNPWVRYGVYLARQLELNRKKDEFAQMVIEVWVPSDSPYWD